MQFRGWVVPPEMVQAVQIIGKDGTLLGASPLNARRQDINDKYNVPKAIKTGFDLILPMALTVGDTVTCVLIGLDGNPVGVPSRPISLKSGEIVPAQSAGGKAAKAAMKASPIPVPVSEPVAALGPGPVTVGLVKSPVRKAPPAVKASAEKRLGSTAAPVAKTSSEKVAIPTTVAETERAAKPLVPVEAQTVFEITEVAYFGRAGEIVVRGWAVSSAGIGGIRVRAGRKTIGMATPTIALPEVSARLGIETNRLIGFGLTGQLPDGSKDIEISVLSAANKVLASSSHMVSEQTDLLTDLAVAYDFDSRQLRVSGCLFPSNHLRQLEVVLARGRVHIIKDIFLYRPKEISQDPRGVTLYSGFSDRIQHVGEGELRPAKLRLCYTDGTSREWEIPGESIKLKQPEAEIEKVDLDWLERRYSVQGWYRSHEPITDLQLTLNGKPTFGIPRVVESDIIQKRHAFRGVKACEFTFDGSIDAAVSDASDLFGQHLVATLKLRQRETVLFEVKDVEVPATVRWGYLSHLQFDRRTNVFHASGGVADPAMPRLAQLVVNGRPIDRPLPLEVSTNGKSGFFSWTHEVNAAMVPGSKVALQFFDNSGNPLGEIVQGELEILYIAQANSVEGLSLDQLAKRLVQTALRYRLGDGPSVCIVYQGTVTGTITGGGPQRVLDLMASFHDAGYTTILIDRSEPWNLLNSAGSYSQLRRICDIHLMVPQAMKRAIITELSAVTTESPGHLLADFAPQGMPFGNVLNAALAKQPEVKGLAQRSDQQFNVASATLINLLKPRVMITNFAWGAPIADYVHPSIHRMVDTHDVQALRSEAFRQARETFGEEAVPSLDRYSVDLQDELGLLTKADSLIAISSDERDFLVKHVAPAKVVLAHISTRFTTALPPSPPESMQVMFVGNAYEPNTDGIRRFIAESWPKVIKKLPKARLVICGRVCGTLAGISDPTIRLRGVVDNLDAVYSESAVTLNPVRFGTGASVKLIEALSRGRVVLSTDVGAKGFAVREDSDGLQILTLDKFAEAIIALLSDPKARHKAEIAAYDFARAHFSPSIAHTDLFNLLESKLYY